MDKTPMIFSGPMIEKILAAQKRVTRRFRPVKKQYIWVKETYLAISDEGYPRRWMNPAERDNTRTWSVYYRCTDLVALNTDFPNTDLYKWDTPLFMPYGFSRIDLKVVSCGQQRLQDITEPDAIDEGFESVQQFREYWDMLYKGKPGQQWADNPVVYPIRFKIDRFDTERLRCL